MQSGFYQNPRSMRILTTSSEFGRIPDVHRTGDLDARSHQSDKPFNQIINIAE